MQHLSLFAIQKGPRETKFSKGWQRLERLPMGGFKLHLVINETGEGVTVTKGNVDDRKPVNSEIDWFGDKGYIKKDLFHELFDRGLKLVTSIKKGMKNSLMVLNEKILLRKRLRQFLAL